MFNKKITRKEFLISGFIAMAALMAAPIYKLFDSRRNLSRKKEAKYYKNLAG